MTRRLVMLLAGVLGTTVAVPAVADDAKAPWRIVLREHARAGGPTLTLGDVADLRTGDLPAIRALVALPLATGVRPGRPVALSRDAIQRAVEPLAAKAGVPVTLGGAERVHAERASQTVDGDRIAKVARDALARALVSKVGAADVALIRPPRDVVLPSGVLTVVPIAVLGPTDWLRRASVWVQLYVDGRLETAVPVDFQVEGVVALLPASASATMRAASEPVRPLARAERSDEAQRGLSAAFDDQVPRETRAAPMPSQLALADHAAATRRTPDAPDATPAVQRGRPAVLRSNTGPIAMEVQVQVLQDGRVGDTVRVQAPAGTGPVAARVVSEGVLEMAQ